MSTELTQSELTILVAARRIMHERKRYTYDEASRDVHVAVVAEQAEDAIFNYLNSYNSYTDYTDLTDEQLHVRSTPSPAPVAS